MGVAERYKKRQKKLPDRSRWYWRASFFSLLLIIALPLAVLFIAHRLWIRRKGLVGLREKLTGEGTALTHGQILVHGVSLGEVNLMRPLVPELERSLRARCLLTTTTETGYARLQELFPSHDRAFLPLDFPWAVSAFLRRAKPRMVIMLELEIWPMLLCLCHLRGIPVLLLNARVSERSFAGYRRGGALLWPLLHNLHLALGQNALWTARLIALGAARARTRVSGSMKADMVHVVPVDKARTTLAPYKIPDNKPILLLASTSAGALQEEAVVLAETWRKWQEHGWQIIICPRHPERGTELAQWITALGGHAIRSSQGQILNNASDILIIDEIGKLGALYALTAATQGIAIVGGSLGSGRGGQNMLESAAAGCCTVVGWDTRNFPDAMALLRAENGVISVDQATIITQLDNLRSDIKRRQQCGENGRRAYEQGRGAVSRSVEMIRELSENKHTQAKIAQKLS
jgi:3-deoxy-D-manno-octulosonic-acid transferase